MKIKYLTFLFGIIIFSSACSVNQLTEIGCAESISTYKLSKSIFSSPIATRNNNVVIGCHDKNIYFFNSEGKLLNTHNTGGWVHASPSVLSDGTVAVGSYDGYIYFFTKNGQLKNKYNPQSGSLFTSIIELPDGRLVFGSNKKGIVFYNPNNSSTYCYPVKKWVHGTPGIIDKDKVVIGSNDKKVYILDSDANLINSFTTKGWIMHSGSTPVKNNNFAIGSYDRSLYIINKDGDQISKFKTKGRIHATPIALSNHKIVFGSFDKFIYFLKHDGSLFKKFKTQKKVVSSPVTLSDGTVVIGSYDKNLYFFSSEAKFLGTYKTKGKIFSTPIVLSNDTIVVCTTNGYVEFIKVKSTLAKKI